VRAIDCQWELISSTHQRSAKLTKHLDGIVRELWSNQRLDIPFYRIMENADLPSSLQSDLIAASKEEWHNYVLPWKTIYPETTYPYIFAIKTEKRTRFWTIPDAQELYEFGQMIKCIAEKSNNDQISEEQRTSKYWIGLNDIGFVQSQDVITSSRSERSSLNKVLGQAGIHRLQHACLLFRSSKTSVLVDPQFSFGCCEGEDWPTIAEIGSIDAVVISHSHTDHFCKASLLMFDRNTQMIVPKVDNESMLCPNMALFLKDAGFKDIKELKAGESLCVGDITINGHPFYGEQPWMNLKEPIKSLRNIGLTYVIECGAVRSWLLVDSGQEFSNSMVNYARECRDELGRLDYVFSNMRQFGWAPNSVDGTGRYLFCYPEEIVINPRMWPSNQIMTLGCGGLAEILESLGNITFYPYAHWWNSPHRKVNLDSENMLEEKAVYELSQITSSNIVCKNWNIGDLISIE